MELLIACMLIGLIPGVIAASRGHNFLLWWLFGAALFIVALPCSLFLKSPERKAEEDARRVARDAALAQLVANTTAAQGAATAAAAAPSGDTRDCPWCAETIKAAARICRFCNRDVDPVERLDPAAASPGPA
ncbi:hypothetical protein [Brevundimonas sp.]|uniref:hypothetical protein n=1 Tax=Brevundimonas sp. TaxID=1871086 RepID=UPI002D516DF2|nr:hypothetical protein [Brevundimonas sp.]HYD26943.1 hypothetical protein [Brevundimonas sp.]